MPMNQKTEYLVRVVTKYTSRPGIDPMLADAMECIAELLIDLERRVSDVGYDPAGD